MFHSSRLAAWAGVAACALALWQPPLSGQAAAGTVEALPSARLEPANPLQLRATVDSNSPAFWTMAPGPPLLHVFASSAEPLRMTGTALGRLGEPHEVAVDTTLPGGMWMESILPDVDGSLYGFYHHEPDNAGCGTGQKTSPRIGMAVSGDQGLSWHDLGIVLQAPAREIACATPNKYFAGGVGDLTAVLAPDQFVYLFFTSYSLDAERQGVSAARMAWADRAAPRGTLDVWGDGVWRPAGRDRVTLLSSPLWPNEGTWHDGDALRAYWGPAVHWNTYLQQYVMLLNRAGDHLWNQEGVYVAYAKTLADPSRWSAPELLVSGGRWYPQVIGTAVGSGTDREAGRRARFFISGRSESTIVFTRPS